MPFRLISTCPKSSYSLRVSFTYASQSDKGNRSLTWLGVEEEGQVLGSLWVSEFGLDVNFMRTGPMLFSLPTLVFTVLSTVLGYRRHSISICAIK